MSTLEDRSGEENFLDVLRVIYPGVQVCHRLDKETSGVLICAKNKDTYKYMSALFERRKVRKVYHALVQGAVQWKDRVVDKPILKQLNGRVRIDRRGKPSVTHCSSLVTFKNHTLMSCLPLTGRMHQIRIHLAHEGYPICADGFYGGQPIFLSNIKRNYLRKGNKPERPLLSRVALHALSINFSEADGKSMYFEAPYPKDFNAAINQLRRSW